MKQNSESTHAGSGRAGQQPSGPASFLRSLDDELLALRRTFYEEAEERLAEVEGLLLDLERRPDDPDLTNTIFRAVHSVKGGAAACEFTELASFAHAFESLLACLRKGQLRVTQRLLDVLLTATDVLATLLACAKDGRSRGEGAVVERSLDAIRLELAQLPASEEPDGPVVDLSVGLVIWDDEPAPPSAPVTTPMPVHSGVYPSDRSVSKASSRATTPPQATTPPPAASAPVTSLAAQPVTAPVPARTAPAALSSRRAASLAPMPAPARDFRDYTLDAVLVRLGDRLYGLATAHVEAFLQPSEGSLREVPFQGTVLLTEERGLLPLTRLETLLGGAASPAPIAERVAVVVGVNGRRSAVLVDEVLTQGSLLVKRLEPNFQCVPGIAGAAEFDDKLALVVALDRLL